MGPKVVALLRDRKHAAARIRHKFEAWADRFTPPATITETTPTDDLGKSVGCLVSRPELHEQAELNALATHIDQSRLHLRSGPFPIDGLHNGTDILGRLCYHLCRQTRPRVVVETGVAYGVTSTYLLKALLNNRQGQLYSIDLPPVGSDPRYVGSFVPAALRTQWRLRIAPASTALPELLSQLPPIDMFLHDSLHTYAHMKWEFEIAISRLNPGGVIVSDDIEGNRAFEELTRHPMVDKWMAIRQPGKNALCGAVRIKC